MKKGKIIFTGSFIDWLFSNLIAVIICFILAVPTLGISILYLGYYQLKYFVGRLEIIMEG